MDNGPKNFDNYHRRVSRERSQVLVALHCFEATEEAEKWVEQDEMDVEELEEAKADKK